MYVRRIGDAFLDQLDEDTHAHVGTMLLQTPQRATRHRLAPGTTPGDQEKFWNEISSSLKSVCGGRPPLNRNQVVRGILVLQDACRLLFSELMYRSEHGHGNPMSSVTQDYARREFTQVYIDINNADIRLPALPSIDFKSIVYRLYDAYVNELTYAEREYGFWRRASDQQKVMHILHCYSKAMPMVRFREGIHSPSVLHKFIEHWLAFGARQTIDGSDFEDVHAHGMMLSDEDAQMIQHAPQFTWYTPSHTLPPYNHAYQAKPGEEEDVLVWPSGMSNDLCTLLHWVIAQMRTTE
jgi:hypothetical protein